MLTIVDRLKMSAARIRAGNWTQGRYRLMDGRACAIGGMLTEHENCLIAGALHDQAAPLVAEALGIDPIKCNIPVWNDALGQTAENVADTLDLAALIGEIRAQKDFTEPTRVIEWLQEEKVLCLVKS